MHITINRAELLAAVKRASTIAPPDSPLDVLRGVLLETDSANGMLTVAGGIVITFTKEILNLITG